METCGMMELTPELLEAAKRFSDPVVLVDVNFPGVEMPERMRQGSRNGRVVIEITEQLVPCLHLSAEWFELVTETERVRVPWGAVVLMDRKTGEGFTLNPANLRGVN
jgi:stringent starvation protein B